ncbi:MAG: glycosyl hydrolase family 2, partial [Rikenellaceae bacterium]|nr:glycosyl hydrolase family 2 [Rikenellaceae bacterium]
MKKIFYLTFAALLAASCANSQETNWPETKPEHKPFTRWWWLGNAVDKENLTYNLEEFAKAGMGGVEIASIYGVKGEDHREIPYLSDQWMEMYTHTVSEANRLGMIVDLTNGTGWPFGGPNTSMEDAASKLYIREYTVPGGANLEEKIEYILPPSRGKTEPRKPRDGEISLVSVMAYSNGGQKIDLMGRVSADGSLDWTAPEGDWTVYALFNGKTLQAVKRSSPGGEGLVFDHLSKTATQNYLQQFTEAFERTGSPLPRMFFNDSYEVYG